METNINKILIINNKNYQLICDYKALDGTYLYLINKDDYNDILFVKLLDNNEVEVIKDQNTMAYIVKMMTKKINTLIF